MEPEVYAGVIHSACFHDAADIKQQNSIFKSGGNRIQQLGFFRCQVEAARLPYYIPVFTGGTALNVDIPAGVSVVGEPTFEPGKSYIINVRDNMLVAAEYTPGVTE